MELTRRNIPFVKFGGLRFLDAAHVKDMLALLRFVENPRDRVAVFRLTLLLPGIGPTSVQRALDYMAGAADPIDALKTAPPPPRAGDEWYSFTDTLAALRSGRAGWPAELERARVWYEPHLERIHDDAVTRRADLIQLEQIASGYPSRERFLTELTLDPPQATTDRARPEPRPSPVLRLPLDRLLGDPTRLSARKSALVCADMTSITSQHLLH